MAISLLMYIFWTPSTKCTNYLEENLGELYILCQYDNYGLKCSFVLKIFNILKTILTKDHCLKKNLSKLRLKEKINCYSYGPRVRYY